MLVSPGSRAEDQRLGLSLIGFNRPFFGCRPSSTGLPPESPTPRRTRLAPRRKRRGPTRSAGRPDRLRRPRDHAVTDPPHTSGPHARSTAYPTHEDFDQGPPSPRTGSSPRTNGPATDPSRCPTVTHRSPTRSPGAAAALGGTPPSPGAPD